MKTSYKNKHSFERMILIISLLGWLTSPVMAQNDDFTNVPKMGDPEGSGGGKWIGSQQKQLVCAFTLYPNGQCYKIETVSASGCPAGETGNLVQTDTYQVHDTAYDGLGIIDLGWTSTGTCYVAETACTLWGW